MNIRPYVEFLKLEKISQAEGLKLLKDDINLSSSEKNLIYAYCYPRQLLDRELPSRVQNFRKNSNLPLLGTTDYNIGEITLIIEAGQTEQYGRFIKHLMHAFCDSSKVFQVEELEGEKNCCICGKNLLGITDWENTFSDVDHRKEKLAFGSTESSVILCIDCLTQLLNAYNLINEFDPGFLDWTKKMKLTSETPLTWADIKLK